VIIFFLIFWTFIAMRTTFGRHVYAVGGNAEAARAPASAWPASGSSSS
jgi:ABC-type xylose transport system, permease component